MFCLNVQGSVVEWRILGVCVGDIMCPIYILWPNNYG